MGRKPGKADLRHSRDRVKPDLGKLEKDELIRLMELPNYLRETMLTVIALGEADASEVSEQTGRSRTSESDRLNQLERMGYLKRRHAWRRVYFSPARGMS